MGHECLEYRGQGWVGKMGRDNSSGPLPILTSFSTSFINTSLSSSGLVVSIGSFLHVFKI